MNQSPETLPLFVYGSLQPGELAHQQIAHLVDESMPPAELEDYGLWIRDGLPFAAPSPGDRVQGHLLRPLTDHTEEFYTIVCAFEGDELYSKDVLSVVSNGARVKARVFVGRRKTRGNPEAIVHGAWSLRSDPLLTFGMDAVWRAATRLIPQIAKDRPGLVETAEFWDVFVPLQGLYLVLSSVAERYATLRFGQSVNPAQKFTKLDEDPRAAEAAREAQPPQINVVDSRSANGPRSTVTAPFAAWYQVRNNLTHRGKGGYHDITLVRKAVVGLHDTMRLLVGAELAEHQRDEFTAPDRMLRPLP